MDSLCKINTSFMLFKSEELFLYIISMQDKNIVKLSAMYCYMIYYLLLILLQQL